MSTNSRFSFTALGLTMALAMGGCAAATEEDVASDPQPAQAAQDTQQATPEKTGETSEAITAEGWGGFGFPGFGLGFGGLGFGGLGMAGWGGLGWGGLGFGGLGFAPLIGFSPDDAPASDDPPK